MVTGGRDSEVDPAPDSGGSVIVLVSFMFVTGQTGTADECETMLS